MKISLFSLFIDGRRKCCFRCN